MQPGMIFIKRESSVVTVQPTRLFSSVSTRHGFPILVMEQMLLPCLIQTPLPLSSGSLAISEYYPISFVKLEIFSWSRTLLWMFLYLYRSPYYRTFFWNLDMTSLSPLLHASLNFSLSNQATEIALVKIKSYFCVAQSNYTFLIMFYLTPQQHFSCPVSNQSWFFPSLFLSLFHKFLLLTL